MPRLIWPKGGFLKPERHVLVEVHLRWMKEAEFLEELEANHNHVCLLQKMTTDHLIHSSPQSLIQLKAFPV